MITFLKNWSNQIIIATIIAIILEMILPEGNNKKYIKMIIGIYVLFTIISPVITKITGNSLEFENFDYSQYFDDTIEISSNANEFDESNSKLIKQAYIENIENDIKSKIQQKGYKVANCKINIIEDHNSEKYGTITNITLQLKKIEYDIENTKKSNDIQIENVEVSIDNNENSQEEIEEEKSEIKYKEIIALKEYLATEYSIAKDFININ